MLVFHPEVTGSIPAAFVICFSAGLRILAILSFLLNPQYSAQYVAGWHLPSKMNPEKSYGMFKNFIFHNPNP